MIPTMSPVLAQLKSPSKPLPNKDVCSRNKNDTGTNSHKIAARCESGKFFLLFAEVNNNNRLITAAIHSIISPI